VNDHDSLGPTLAPADVWWPPGEAGRVLRRAGRVVPVVGAGFSKLVGLPLASELGAWMAATLGGSANLDSTRLTDCKYVADEIVATGVDPLDLRSQVAAQYDLSVRGTVPGIGARSLVHVPSKHIVTLNYDRVLEEAANAEGIPCQSLTWRDLDQARAALSPESDRSLLTIVHIHGSVDEPGQIVLDYAGYKELQNEKRVEEYWRSLTRDWRLLFLGISIDEPYVVEIIEAVQGGNAKHVIVADGDTIHKFQHERAALNFPRHGITDVMLPNDSSGAPRYTALNGLAWQLTAHFRTASSGGPVLACDDEPLPHCYTANALVEPDPERSEEVTSLLAEWDFAGERRTFSRLFGEKQPSYTEADVARMDRALIIGEPGSGKTELLRVAGREVEPGVQPVLIRLADVPTRPGDPAKIFAAWAARGIGLVDDVIVSKEALESAAFHFFLDALDEVPAPARGEAAERIQELARAFAEHRFTVTARPMEELEMFAEDRWRTLRVTPTQRWQDAYLTCKGLSWEDDLEPRLEAINDARELLRLPFFLSRVVEMSDNGKLETVGDLWGLLQALVTDALERETDVIAIDADDARQWLRKVALAMHLAGRASLAADEIRQIALPSNVTSSHDDVCDDLVARLLLRPSGTSSEIRFTHRMFGACLAAEALSELHPTPEFVQALAPRYSDKISGVRRDLVVPVSLLLSRESPWRAPIQERDPLLVAYATASDAPVELRAEAARAIWDHAIGSGVWIWDYDLPEAIEGRRALGSLLAAGGLDELADEIKQAIDSPEMHLQGNAIRVLASATRTDIEPELERVLRDDEREAVVRRQAAIAAAELRLVDLLDLIVERAVGPADDAERQDSTLMAMTLAPDDRVLGVALRLAEAGRWGRGIAIAHTRRRLGVNEALAVMRRAAEHHRDHFDSAKDELLEAIELPEELTAQAIRDAFFCAVIWEMDDEAIGALIERDREAALHGVRDALEHGGVDWWWHNVELLQNFEPDELRAVQAPPEIVAAAERRVSESEEVAAAAAESVADEAGDEPEQAAKSDVEDETTARDPTLAELLERERDDETDYLIAHNSRYFAREAAELPVALSDELQHRLDDWWPTDKPYAATITWRGGNSWSQENGAAAWVTYGPPLDKDLTPSQWGQIVASGVAIFEDQGEWLARHYTEEGLRGAIELMDTQDADRWQELFRAIPQDASLPSELADAVIAHLKKGETYYVESIARRLGSAFGVEPLIELSKVSTEFEATIRPVLGEHGHRESLERLLADLQTALAAGAKPDSDELTWLLNLDGDPAWLEPLFECLFLAYTTTSERRGISDPVSPLTVAIQHVGVAAPDDVVTGYEGLFARDDRCRWLRRNLDGFVEIIVSSAGMEAAPAAAEAARVPFMQAPSGLD
jgi:hypothetical protein